MLPIINGPGGCLRDIMSEALPPEAAVTLNEVLEELGTPNVQFMDEFSLRIMFSSADAKIDAGNVTA